MGYRQQLIHKDLLIDHKTVSVISFEMYFSNLAKTLFSQKKLLREESVGHEKMIAYYKIFKEQDS